MGRPGKRPRNDAEPRPDVLSPRSKPAEWLDPIARREWKRIVPELSRLGLLTKCDRTALEVYCDAYSTLVRCAEILNQKGFVFKTPNGHIAQLPHANIKNAAAQTVKAFCAEFGLTPSSRSRMKVFHDKAEEDVDPMEALLAGGTPDLKVVNGGKK